MEPDVPTHERDDAKSVAAHEAKPISATTDAAVEFALEPTKLTWAVLLGRWIDFARSGVGLPASGEGRRMRDSIADVIILQAVWFALKNLGELAAEEKALGLDRAAVLIEKHESALRQRWGVEMPPSMRELISDATHVLAASRAVSGPPKVQEG